MRFEVTASTWYRNQPINESSVDELVHLQQRVLKRTEKHARLLLLPHAHPYRHGN